VDRPQGTDGCVERSHCTEIGYRISVVLSGGGNMALAGLESSKSGCEMSCEMGGLRDSSNLAASSANDGRSRSQISPTINTKRHVGHDNRRVSSSWHGSRWFLLLGAWKEEGVGDRTVPRGERRLLVFRCGHPFVACRVHDVELDSRHRHCGERISRTRFAVSVSSLRSQSPREMSTT
jgi:hypothetical protein